MSAFDEIDALPTHRMFAQFRPGGGDGLGEQCVRLLEEQIGTWMDCRRGYEGLARAGEREVHCTGFSVLLQHNPGRAMSTEARVAEGDITRRPCFLCLDRLPRGQRMILYGSSYAMLANPMPIFSPHITVAHRCHQPQAISENIAALLGLAEDLGEGWTTLYNGPRCGASAPDHLHFQVVAGGKMPVEKEIADPERLLLRREIGGARVYSAGRLGRAAVVLEAVHSQELTMPLVSLLKGLARVIRPPEPPRNGIDLIAEEPLVNIAVFRRSGKTSLLMFPRRIHRPAAFFFSGEGRIAVSPAAAEMGGIIVTPEERDFVRLTADVVEELYREVSLDGLTVQRAIDSMGE